MFPSVFVVLCHTISRQVACQELEMQIVHSVPMCAIQVNLTVLSAESRLRVGTFLEN